MYYLLKFIWLSKFKFCMVFFVFLVIVNKGLLFIYIGSLIILFKYLFKFLIKVLLLVSIMLFCIMFLVKFGFISLSMFFKALEIFFI